LSCEPYDDRLARAVCNLAIAYLDRPFCAPGSVLSYVEALRVDLTLSGDAGSYFNGTDVTANPFGTRRGAVEAWQIVRHYAPNRPRVASV
jgi:hypothetical protein